MSSGNPSESGSVVHLFADTLSQTTKGALLSIGVILFCGYHFRKFLNYLNEKRTLYASIPTLETSAILGKILGHIEYIWIGYNRSITVPLFVANLLNGIAFNSRQFDYGLVHIRIGPFRDLVFFMNAKVAEALLKHPRNIIKSDEYFFMKPWLGQGLLTSAGTHWRQHRKLLTPTFHFEILNKFIPTMNRQLKTLHSLIEQHNTDSNKPETDPVIIDDIRPLVINCTVDIICETAMGIKLNAQQTWIDWKRNGSNRAAMSHESGYVEALKGFFDIMIERIISPWLHADWLFRWHPLGRRFQKHVDTMHLFTNNVIQKRKQELEPCYDREIGLEESIKKLSQSGRKLAFLDLMILYHLNNPTEFDLVSIREEVDTFMFGGHDTTSTTLHFAMMLIGLNLDKQELIFEELQSIFGDQMERDIKDEDIRQMRYLEQCIKESLRLYPAAVFFARKITEPFQCDRYHVPAGCTAVVLVSAIHRDPEIYQNAEHFQPERFEPNSPVLRSPFAFIPFSAGLRNCIGQKFAMLELKLFLASILRRYQIRSLTQRNDVLVDFSIIAKSSTPIKMEFIRRNL